MFYAFCGSHGNGKTTLLNKFKEIYPTFGYATETARDCPFPINEKTDFRSQDWILREELKRELDKPLNEVTICDRTTYDQLAYAWYARDNGTISEEKFQELKKYSTTWGMLYDHIFYIPIEFDLVKDGVRSEDEEYRKNIDERIHTLLDTYKDPENITILKGTVEERFEQAKEVIFRLVDTKTELTN